MDSMRSMRWGFTFCHVVNSEPHTVALHRQHALSGSAMMILRTSETYSAAAVPAATSATSDDRSEA